MRAGEAALILVVEQSRPEVEDDVNALALLGEHGEEPFHGVELWVDRVAGEDVADGWIVVL